MPFPKRTPLAWLNLVHDRLRFIISLGGVAFAVLLMFVFTGFMNALYDSQIQLLKQLNGEIIIINRLKSNMVLPASFARRRLYQALAFEGVEAAYALYTSDANWKNPETKRTRPVRILAFNLADPVLPLPDVEANLKRLQLPNTALIDTQARAEVGPTTAGIVTELADREIRIVGTFTLGTDFASGNGNLIMSDQNFLRYFADRGPEEDTRSFATVDVGLLKVSPNVDIDALVATLSDRLPQDVSILPKEGPAGFVQRERTYWQENTNIGFVFSLLTLMGFGVGVILVYQILYTDVADHWAEYATLKAMGYSNQFLLGIVLQEALILSALGFLPGFCISNLLYALAGGATGLTFQMTIARVGMLYATTFIMCLISGAIAVRKVQTADPADVFGG
ncbi:MAG: ABC transporter permease DevC [Leptolyngbyaceae cyanobacterium MO_188.B28]|nr:ABC transporter permease DevC [Leptolyngbyaceae cyanobacterium MO_188.B28]